MLSKTKCAEASGVQIKEALNWANKKLIDLSSATPAMQAARRCGQANLDAEILLLESLNPKHEKSFLIAHSDYQLSQKEFEKFKKLIKRRQKHEPIAYIISSKEFYGLDFFVNKNVLIPRPETEILVDEVLKSVKKNTIIAEIGTGSGCISIALAKSTQSKIYASDISTKALSIAKLNAKKHKVYSKIKFFKGDLLKAFPPKYFQKVQLIVTNLPYLDKNFKNLLNSSERKAICFEPKLAWDGGGDGARIYQKLFLQLSQNWHGKILLEMGCEQTDILKKIIKTKFPKAKIKLIKDYANLPRILKIIL